MSVAIPPLYAIMDADLLRGAEVSVAGLLLGAGVRLFQVRNKQASARQLLATSHSIIELLRGTGARILINDRPDVAVLCGADGVHVGQSDVWPADVRSFGGVGLWIGVSTHTEEQVRAAGQSEADYVAVGPVFATDTKRDPEPVVGLELVTAARRLTRKPVVAIGGITAERAGEVYEAGADCIAVARDLILHSDPARRAREYFRAAAKRN